MSRQADVLRQTLETQIDLAIDLDGSGVFDGTTGIGFMDHMMALLAYHSGMNMVLKMHGDLEVDDHHSIEDLGIALGKAIALALGNKKGIHRYGNCRLVMDESLACVDLDFSGRPYLVFNAELTREIVGDLSTEMVEEFLRALAFNSGLTLHVNLEYGKNDHHKIEAIFKALARAMKMAWTIDCDHLVSSKGALE